LDQDDDTVCIGQNLVVPESQHQPPLRLKKLVASIMVSSFGVLSAISLDRNTKRRTREIEHERRYGMLTPEMPAEAVASQSRPETAFRVGWRSSGAAGHFDFVLHWRHPLPTLPRAQRGRGGVSAPSGLPNV
jgi:hypothetical protein